MSSNTARSVVADHGRIVSSRGPLGGHHVHLAPDQPKPVLDGVVSGIRRFNALRAHRLVRRGSQLLAEAMRLIDQRWNTGNG